MKIKSRKIFSFLLALVFALSIPLSALAIEVDSSYGDIYIGDTHVDHYVAGEGAAEFRSDAHEGSVTITHGDGGQNGTVTVAVSTGTLEVEGNFTGIVLTYGDADVTVTGDIATELIGVYAREDSQVTVYGNIDADQYGVYTYDNSQVTVEGDITVDVDGVDTFGNSQVTVKGNITSGGDGVYAIGNSQVTVEGDIIAGNDGVYALENAQVTVTGNTSGDDDGVTGYGASRVTLNGNVNGGDDGVNSYDDARVTVNGNVCGEEDGVDAGGNAYVIINGTAAGGETDVDIYDNATVIINASPSTEEPEETAVLSFTVTDLSGKPLQHTLERQEDVFVITVKTEEASLVLSRNQLNNLKFQGIKTVRFVTDACTTDLDTAQLLEKGGKAFTLTHKGDKAELTLDGQSAE